MSLHYTAHAQLVGMKYLCRGRGFYICMKRFVCIGKSVFTTKKTEMEHYSTENMIRKYG